MEIASNRSHNRNESEYSQYATGRLLGIFPYFLDATMTPKCLWKMLLQNLRLPE